MKKITIIAIVGQVLLLTLSCKHAPKDNNTNAVIIKAYFDRVWNKGQVNLLDSLLSPDYINHTPSVPNPPNGPAGLKPIVLAIRKAFPDLHYEIKDIIVANNRIVARVVMTGTQTGALFGIPPTGKRIEINQINIEKIENGKIAEHWRVTDELTMMLQLGIVKKQ